jgi:hypothetical protein
VRGLLEIVPSAADSATDHAQQSQDRADDQKDDADGGEDRDVEEVADYYQDDSENDHYNHLIVAWSAGSLWPRSDVR